MKRFAKIWYYVSVALFVGGIAWALFGRAFCTRSNEHYQELQPESFVPDTIQTVLQAEEMHQLYVCYSDANCVNVYTETGDFLWCVATPKMRNPGFDLQDGKLIIFDGDAYLYDAKSGAFLGVEKEENLDVDHSWEREYTETFVEGDAYFDNFQVYVASADGSLKTVVSRPWWHRLFHYGWCLGLAFLGALGIGIGIFIEKKKEYDAIKKTVVFKNRKARRIKNYFRITTFVHVAYTICNIGLAFITPLFIVGIIPLSIHMIVSNMVLWNMKDCLACGSDELQAVDFWGTMELGSFIVAFLSVIVASGIAG